MLDDNHTKPKSQDIFVVIDSKALVTKFLVSDIVIKLTALAPVIPLSKSYVLVQAAGLSIDTSYVPDFSHVNRYLPMLSVSHVIKTAPAEFFSVTKIQAKPNSPLSCIPLLFASYQTVSQIDPATIITNISFDITGNDISGTLAENELVYILPEEFQVGNRVNHKVLRKAHATKALAGTFRRIAVIFAKHVEGEARLLQDIQVAEVFGLLASLIRLRGSVEVTSKPYSPFGAEIELST